MDLVVLAASFAIILGGAALFTNGVEWFGRKLDLAEGAVGSVLAAVGTALPETMIPVVAILFSRGGAATEAVGVGAILGAPFMLGTLALFVAGLAVAWRARRGRAGDVVRVDRRVLGVDVRAFVLSYGIAIGAAVVLPVEPTWPKLVVAAVLLVLYGRYVKGHFDADAAEAEEELGPLHFHRLERRHVRASGGPPRLRLVALQAVAGVALIVVGATVFVGVVSDLSRTLGVSEVLLALVIAPIATELPEGFNSLIWVRQRKDTLAIGNITGAMVFQSAIPTSVALVFAPRSWVAEPGTYLAFASAAIAFLSIAVVFGQVARGGALRGRWLLVGGIFYVAYLAIVLATLGG